MSTQARSILVYGALFGGFMASLALCRFATTTVRDLRLYRASMPHQDTYVLSHRADAPGPEMNFHQLLALHIFLQCFGMALMALFSGWVIWKLWRAMQEKPAR